MDEAFSSADTLKDVQTGTVYAALCGFRVANDSDFDVSDEKNGPIAKAMLIAQLSVSTWLAMRC